MRSSVVNLLLGVSVRV